LGPLEQANSLYPLSSCRFGASLKQVSSLDNTPGRLAPALSDRYRIERELGQGGMATVYLAQDLKHHRQVAIKVLRPELSAALGAERFLREIETTANLRHPHILPLFDSGEADGFLFYVMPYVEGESLRDRLKREKQLPIDDALRITREVADALSYAHSKGVIHRDIKPENMLLESGHAVVADFGIAKAISAAGGQTLTRTGMSVGTPQYMSPEQAAGESDLDGRSDLYSLACVLYEMLAGQPPFSGSTAESLVHQHLVVDARPITQLRPAVPPAIADALTRALAKNPADRFSPAAHFAAALTMPGQDGSRRSPMPRWALGLATAAVVAVIVVGVLLRRRPAATPAVTIGRTTQVTRDPGLEVDPALSPDGTSLAYAAGPTDAMQIYVRQISGGRPVALTADSSDNFRWPRWSPDGSQIAYQSNDGIYIVPALGGPPRRVTRIDPARLRFGVGWGAPIAGFDWSPDGRRILWSLGSNGDGITVKTLASGDTVSLAAPDGASAPAWSPDGRTVAVAVGNPIFTFGTGYFGNAGATAIWLIPLDGSTLIRITPDSSLNVSPQWSPDGRALFWVSDRDGSRDVYRQQLDGRGAVGPPRRLTTGTDAHGLSVSRESGRLAYSHLSAWDAIWSIPVPARGPVSIRSASRITTGNETIEDVDVSPDGRWLVFDSDRGGNPDLYVMPAAGGEARQITTDPAGDFSPDWSSDGRQIVFHSRRNGNRDVYSVDADGTGLRQWTSASDEELDPDWAPDGSAVLFQQFGGATHGFGILPLTGTTRRELIPAVSGDFAHWSPDSKAFLYHSQDGLRVHHLGGGSETLVVSKAADGAEAYYAAWSPDGRRIYYLARSPAGWVILSVASTGGASTVLVKFDDPTRQQTKYGFCTDGKKFYLTIGSPESDIFVAEVGRP
jgi:eukaryotic-like serine/threonine-protein kinase